MTTLWTRVLSDTNLQLAWRRAAQYFATNCSFIDHAEVADFNMDLEANLRSIAEAFASGRYRMAPLRLAPHPKPKFDRALPPVMREIFWLAPRDQVAWLAIANVIGPLLDDQMPPWSYGHRLHDGPGARLICPGDTPSDHFVWPPTSSWPICQRHVVLTARHLGPTGIDPLALHADELAVWRLEMDRPTSHRLPYLAAHQRRDGGCAVHYAAFDIKSFSGCLRLDQVLSGLRAFLPQLDGEPRLHALIERMLEFEVDLSGTSAELAQCEPLPRPGRLEHLPIGLIVQGFLANVAMLPVDDAVSNALTEGGLAHFRFFDDHIVLSTDPKRLCDWLSRYRSIMREHTPSLDINRRKIRPPQLSDCFDRGNPSTPGASMAVFDPDRPQALWTLTALRRQVGEHDSRGWGMRLPAAKLDAIRQALRDPPPADRGAPMMAGTSSTDALHGAVFARMCHMLREFPARGQLLRQMLLFLAQTGFPGLHPLRAELETLAATAPALAASQATLFLQFLAGLLPTVALRMVAPEVPPERRMTACAFLLDLSALETPVLAASSEWYLERSKTNFQHGLQIARAILSQSPDETTTGAVIQLFDQMLEREGSMHQPGCTVTSERILLYWNGLDDAGKAHLGNTA